MRIADLTAAGVTGKWITESAMTLLDATLGPAMEGEPSQELQSIARRTGVDLEVTTAEPTAFLERHLVPAVAVMANTVRGCFRFYGVSLLLWEEGKPGAFQTFMRVSIGYLPDSANSESVS